MLEDIRADSLVEAARLGYPVNANLPLLEVSEEARSQSEIARRLLALYAVVSSSYGFPKEEALNWLKQESLEYAATDSELSFLRSDTSEAQNNATQWQVEALWVLAWAVGCHNALDFGNSCADDFIQLLPDLKKHESCRPFLNNLKRRKFAEILAKCDVAYCLHWGVREAALTGKTIRGAIPGNVMLQRRKAFEWMISDQMWDEVNLDT